MLTLFGHFCLPDPRMHTAKDAPIQHVAWSRLCHEPCGACLRSRLHTAHRAHSIPPESQPTVSAQCLELKCSEASFLVKYLSSEVLPLGHASGCEMRVEDRPAASRLFGAPVGPPDLLFRRDVRAGHQAGHQTVAKEGGRRVRGVGEESLGRCLEGFERDQNKLRLLLGLMPRTTRRSAKWRLKSGTSASEGMAALKIPLSYFSIFFILLLALEAGSPRSP